SSTGKAERLRSSVDTAYPAPAGRTLAVAGGGDLQEALDKAAPGDAIVLQAGAVYRGPFTLPRKEGSGWIVVRTGAGDGDLPPPGTRGDPSFARAVHRVES